MIKGKYRNGGSDSYMLKIAQGWDFEQNTLYSKHSHLSAKGGQIDMFRLIKSKQCTGIAVKAQGHQETMSTLQVHTHTQPALWQHGPSTAVTLWIPQQRALCNLSWARKRAGSQLSRTGMSPCDLQLAFGGRSVPRHHTNNP